MSFLDRAKAAATEAMAKADQALATSGLMTPSGGAGVERALRDYGLLAWRAAHGVPVDPAEQERVTSALTNADAAGQLQYLSVAPPPAAAPPPPGYAAPPAPAAPAAPGSPGVPPAPSSAPPPPAATAPVAPAAVEETGPQGGTAPPPPPPSWA